MSLDHVLITGGGGQLASDLEQALRGRAEHVAAPSRADLDITDEDALARAFADVGPDTVFNCAAFHNVDVCEREEQRAWEVNVLAVKRLAERCAQAGAKLVHLSTNYVFDGSAAAPYTEHDAPNPRSVYALTKLAGEYAALTYAPGALVARSAGLYGQHGSVSKGGNFVERMLRRAREQASLRVVDDQHLQPTFTADLAAALIASVDAGAAGVAHVTAEGACSWYEFTVAFLDIAGVDVPVEPVVTTLAPGSPDRPLNGVLARPAADAAGVPTLRSWREALEDYMTRAGFAAG